MLFASFNSLECIGILFFSVDHDYGCLFMTNTNIIPLFSIVTVCLNDIAGLIKTKASLDNQVFSDYEWIVIDGASTDDTVSLLKSLPNNSCNWISEPDRGLYDAMNKGILLSKGRYLLFLNSGDELASSIILRDVAACINNNGADLIYGDALEEVGNGDFILKSAYSHKFVWYGMFTHHQAMFFARTLAPSEYSTTMRYAADYGFVAAHLKHSHLITRLDYPICKFEAGGISQTGSTKQANSEQWDVRRDILGLSYWQCGVINTLHFLILLLKKRLPVLYRWVRYARA